MDNETVHRSIEIETSVFLRRAQLYSPLLVLLCLPHVTTLCFDLVPNSDPALIIYIVWLCVDYLHFKDISPAPM